MKRLVLLLVLIGGCSDQPHWTNQQQRFADSTAMMVNGYYRDQFTCVVDDVQEKGGKTYVYWHADRYPSTKDVAVYDKYGRIVPAKN